MRSPRDVALIGVSVALAYVLSMLTVAWQAWAGGQVSLEPLPILVLALWRGPAAGIVAGGVEGALHFTRESIAVSPASVLLDYPLAAAALGLAGLVPAGWDPRARALAGTCLGMTGRYCAHVLSGYLYFAQGRAGWPAWSYSLAYNATYMGPSLALHAVLVPLVMHRLAARPRRP